MNRLPSILADGRARSIASVALFALGQAAAAGAAAFATRDVFQALHGAAGLPVTALLTIALSGLAIAGCRVGEQVTAARLGYDYAAAVRLVVFKHLTRLAAADLDRRRRGALALRFVGDLTALRGWVANGVARLVSATIVIPAVALVLVLLNPTLALAAAVPLGVGVTLMILAAIGLEPAHRRLRSRRARLAADLSERLPQAPELRLLGRSARERKHLERRSQAVTEAATERARRQARLLAGPDAMAGATAASLLTTAALTQASPAEAAGALAALGLLLQPLRELARIWDRRRAWVLARGKCEALLQMPTMKRRRSRERPGGEADRRLRFDRVRIGDASPFSVDAAPGERIAVVGANGAGKSTLLGLAAGLDRPYKGRVDIAAGLRIALVGGRAPMLGGSLRRALTMGCTKVPEDATLLEAARAFGLDGLVDRLGGLDGRVVEGGRNLATSERRRILLVRAHLTAPDLLVMDEADGPLDAAGRALVDQLIDDTRATVIVVTHEPALIRRLDTVWFMRGGRVVEAGPPATLLARNGNLADFIKPRAAA